MSPLLWFSSMAGDGVVWFSAPTREHTLAQVTLDVWDSRPTGRFPRLERSSSFSNQA